MASAGTGREIAWRAQARSGEIAVQFCRSEAARYLLADASAVIAQFTASREMWIVAVRQVSEGTDIPRLRGVWVTNASTEFFPPPDPLQPPARHPLGGTAAPAGSREARTRSAA